MDRDRRSTVASRARDASAAGSGCDDQTIAAFAPEQAACRREEGAVSRSQAWALDLTAQNLELMAEHEQLGCP